MSLFWVGPVKVNRTVSSWKATGDTTPESCSHPAKDLLRAGRPERLKEPAGDTP